MPRKYDATCAQAAAYRSWRPTPPGPAALAQKLSKARLSAGHARSSCRGSRAAAPPAGRRPAPPSRGRPRPGTARCRGPGGSRAASRCPRRQGSAAVSPDPGEVARRRTTPGCGSTAFQIRPSRTVVKPVAGQEPRVVATEADLRPGRRAALVDHVDAVQHQHAALPSRIQRSAGTAREPSRGAFASAPAAGVATSPISTARTAITRRTPGQRAPPPAVIPRAAVVEADQAVSVSPLSEGSPPSSRSRSWTRSSTASMNRTVLSPTWRSSK